jgi:hypothetical protein
VPPGALLLFVAVVGIIVSAWQGRETDEAPLG